jgi:hypothetical protein
VSVLIAGIITLGACASSHRATSSPPADPSTATSTSTATATTPATAPATAVTPTPTNRRSAAAFSFDHSVPPPALVDTGTDYVAIAKSVEAYGNWLGAHRPDPTLVPATVAPGTQLLKRYVDNLTSLRDANTRVIEKLNGPTTYTILSATPDAFSVRRVSNISVWQSVNESGTVTSERRFAGLRTYLDVYVLSHGRWYAAASDLQEPPVVHL